MDKRLRERELKEEGRRKKEEGKIIVIVIVILIENKTWMYRMNRM